MKIVRDHIQEDSLHQVNKLIDNMIKELKDNPAATKLKCLSFMNSCSSYCENGNEDKNFEHALLGCTIDDQKKVKKRQKESERLRQKKKTRTERERVINIS